MNKPLSILDEPTLCRYLQTKPVFGLEEQAGLPWGEGAATNQSFRCLQTTEAAGPDEQLAHPESCRSARACFTKKR